MNNASIFLGCLLVVVAGAFAVSDGASPDMPLPRAGCIAGIVDGKLVLAGGTYWVNGEKRWTDRTDRFDPSKNRWTTGPPLPEARSDAACATIRGGLFAFGGSHGDAVFRDALQFRNGRWERVPESRLPEPRDHAAAAVVGGEVYVLGGCRRPGVVASATNTLWVWTKSAEWKELAALPGPGRFAPAIAAAEDSIYVFGGAIFVDGTVQNVNDIQRYDPRTDQWTKIGELPEASRAGWAVLGNGRIFLVGGYTSDFASTIEEFNPRTHKVRSAGTLPHPLAAARFFLIGGRLWGASGETAPKVRAPWTLELEVPGVVR